MGRKRHWNQEEEEKEVIEEIQEMADEWDNLPDEEQDRLMDQFDNLPDILKNNDRK